MLGKLKDLPSYAPPSKPLTHSQGCLQAGGTLMVRGGTKEQEVVQVVQLLVDAVNVQDQGQCCI